MLSLFFSTSELMRSLKQAQASYSVVIICLYFNDVHSILILKCKAIIIMFTWNCLSNFLRKKEVFQSPSS